MTKYLIIEADTNDGDYITEKQAIATEEELEDIKRIVEVIRNCKKRHNWPNGECARDGELEALYDGLLSPNEIDFFSQYVPNGEYGIHTIVSVEILVVSEEITLL